MMTMMEGKLTDMQRNQNLGTWGEDQALAHLLSKGLVLLDRNFRVVVGEVDLIMDDKGTLVFVEVKTRRSLQYGSPEESITQTKKEKIYKAAIEYIERNQLDPCDWRMDVVAIECSIVNEVTRIDHYANIEYQAS
jgi:putative endonuclease